MRVCGCAWRWICNIYVYIICIYVCQWPKQTYNSRSIIVSRLCITIFHEDICSLTTSHIMQLVPGKCHSQQIPCSNSGNYRKARLQRQPSPYKKSWPKVRANMGENWFLYVSVMFLSLPQIFPFLSPRSIICDQRP